MASTTASTQVPKSVREVLAGLLDGRSVTLDERSLEQSLLGLGLDSLHVVELQLELEQALDIELGDNDQIARSLGTLPLRELIALVEARVVTAAKKPGA